MKASDEIINFLKSFEVLKLEAYYPTPNDVLTIGYGHTHGVYEGQKITEEQAEQYLMDDIGWAEKAVNELVLIELKQYQFDALVSLVFNIGLPQFESSSLLEVLNTDEEWHASGRIGQWVYQKSDVLNGLVSRRSSEQIIFNGFGYYRVELKEILNEKK